MNEKRCKEGLAQYMRETLLNKIVAVVLILIGVFSVYIAKDITFLITTLMMGIPLFVAKENYIG